LERLQKLSKETGYTLSAITTAYARDSGLNASPLCAYSSIGQLKDSFGALQFKLTKEQVKYLETGE
jgi:aryl-alcohol dehydrogenase-like predicted oxidoreductase